MRLTFKVFAGSVRLHPGAHGCVLGYTLVLHGFLIIAPEAAWAANGSFDIKGRTSEMTRGVPRVAGGRGSGGFTGEKNHRIDMNANSLIISMYVDLK